MRRQQWNPCNGALLPSFRRAIIAFRAQLLPLCRRPGLKQPTANSCTSICHTYARIGFISSIRRAARPWLFSRYMLWCSRLLCLALALSLFSLSPQHVSTAIGRCCRVLCAVSRRDVTTPTTAAGFGGCYESAASSTAKPWRSSRTAVAVASSDVR